MARAFAILVWCAVAASAGFWGWKLFGAGTAPALTGAGESPARPREPQGAAQRDLTRLLGADPPRAPIEPAPLAAESARFQLLGVIAPRPSGAAKQGVALIVVDGRPARAYRVGAMIDEDRVLQSVHGRGVSLTSRSGAPALSLDLPELAPPATGRLPAAVSGNPPPAGPIRPPNTLVSPDRPAPPSNRRVADSAPNTQMNNPSDMAPADPSGGNAPATR